jgi:hypothetical protein
LFISLWTVLRRILSTSLPKMSSRLIYCRHNIKCSFGLSCWFQIRQLMGIYYRTDLCWHLLVGCLGGCGGPSRSVN